MGGSGRKDDARVVLLCLGGDRDAFGELVERYQREITLFCHSQVLDASVAEELAQEAFLRAFERLRQLNHHELFRAWLYRIAATVTISHGRRRSEEPVDAAAYADLSTGSVEQYDVGRETDMREIAEGALRRLTVEVRAAVVLRVCEDMSYRDIAERLHIEPATAETRVRRGLSAMRTYLTSVGREDDARDVLRYGIAGALVGSDIVAAVMERIASMPDPRDPNARDRDMRTSAALGLAIVGALFIGIGALNTGAHGSDAPNAGKRSASMAVTPLSDFTFGGLPGPLGLDAPMDGPRGALYDFESGDLTGWSGRHYNRRLDRYHAIADEALHVQKQTLDNPVILESRGLRFQKEDKGAYLLSTLTTPSFGAFREPFVAEWDVLLGDDNYGMYLAEKSPENADSESEVKIAGIYFSGDTLTAMAAGYPRIGYYRPDTLFHVRIEVDPRTATFTLELDGALCDLTNAPQEQITRDSLPFTGTYSGTGFRHVVFVMGQAGTHRYYDSQMILDNVRIGAASPSRDVVARATLAATP